jgi:hypothetical protein
MILEELSDYFVLVWTIIGIVLLGLVYLSHVTKRVVLPFLASALIMLVVMFSILREDKIRFVETDGRPPNKESVYIHHVIDSINDQLIIRMWSRDKDKNQTRVYVFPYTEEDDRVLERAKDATKKGSRFLIRSDEQQQQNGDSRSRMSGRVQVNSIPYKKD